ncbi:MAG: LysR family transcriptional regulator [Actinomycetota bacterium]|nr:LysR family transcriptional regulator [Actinomycetota bacterium]
MAAYADRLDTPILDLAASLGPAARFWRQPAADVALGKGVAQLVAVAATAGLSEEQLEAMWRPLVRYQALVKTRLGSGLHKWMTRPMRWSRYCPACLADTNGRWQTRWRLPWHLACPTHRTLLSATCPRCDGRQRRRALLQDIETPQTVTCDIPLPDATGRGDHRCGNDLRVGDGTSAPPGLLDLQERLGPLLAPATTDTTMAALIELLADVITVAAQGDLTAANTKPKALHDTTTLAAALSGAFETLTGADPEPLLALALADVRDRPHPLPRSWRTASTALASRVITIRDRYLRPTDRIRWRSTTTGTRPTIAGDDPRHRHVPTALWADWVVRLQPPDHTPDLFSQVAAAALLLPGATRPLASILANWTPDTGLARSSFTILQKLAATDHGPVIFRALTQLGDRLLAYGAPIDYQRRRQLAATATLIDAAQWDRICAQAGAKTGGARKLRWARLWIWETITAGPLEQSPDNIRPTEAVDVPNYHLFPLTMPPQLAELLDAHARRLLDTLGCGNEPLTWSPPATWVNVATLPGRDPASVNPEQIGELLRQRLAPGDVAEQLGITLDHVRLLIRQNPPNRRLRSTGRRPTMRNPFPAQLTPERLQQLVVEDRRSLRSIRTGTKVSKHALRKALRRDGIPAPPSGRAARIKVDESWLRAQYLDRRRTLPDIAAELGMSPGNLARIAQQQHLPTRPRGGGSHAASLTAPADWPHPLADAILGQGGRQRLERFQVYARTRSLNQGAARLSSTVPVLVNQLDQLEHACGGLLIERSGRRQQAQQLTPLGHQLLLQADRHLGPNPDAPPSFPEPLSTALNSFWGAERIRRFQIAADSPSLVEAAAALNTDVHTLARTLRGLETACGGPLLIRDEPRGPHQLTALGRRLNKQARQWRQDWDQRNSPTTRTPATPLDPPARHVQAAQLAN